MYDGRGQNCPSRTILGTRIAGIRQGADVVRKTEIMGPERRLDWNVVLGMYGELERGPSRGSKSLCVHRTQDVCAEANAGSDEREKDEAYLTERKAMILRRAETLCRIGLESEDMTLDRWHSVMARHVLT